MIFNKNMKNFLKKLFRIGPRFKLGAFQSPTDHRLVSTVQFQEPVSLPAFYETELPGVENQGSKPICVGEAFAKLIELYFKVQGIDVDISEEDLYAQCKTIDGIPDQDGTFPVIGAKVSTSGVAARADFESGDVNKIKTSRSQYRVSGYAGVPLNFDAICQAIYQNKAVAAAVLVDNNWFAGIIMRVLKAIGSHMIVLHGFDYNGMILKGQNSWGIEWIGYIAGVMNPKVKPGQFEMKWSDVHDTMFDVFALAKIPQELIDAAKGLEYRFTSNLTQGMRGYDVMKLQERLIKEGFLAAGNATGYFGPITAAALAEYQKSRGISPVGSSCGPLTRAELNRKAPSLIPVLAKAIQSHEGYYAGSRSFRNNNPGNFKLMTSTVTPYMIKLGATGTDAQNFCIFPDYETGFKALCMFLTDAATGRLSSYRADMPIYTGDDKNRGFLDVYAPGFENNTLAYAQAIAKALGVPYTTKMKELL